MRSTTATIMAGATVAISVAAEIASVALQWQLVPLAVSVGWALYNLSVVAIGALILQRLPWHPVGWLLAVLGGFSLLATDLVGGYGLRAELEGWPGAAQAQWLSVPLWSLNLLMWILALLLTPTGRLLSRRWRYLVVAAVVATLLYIPGWLTSATSIAPATRLPNPFVLDGMPSAAVAAAGSGLLIVAAIGAMASLLLRFRGADQVLKQQLKWVGLGASLIVVFLPLGLLAWSTSPLVQAVSPVVLTAVVTTYAAAILRYRLFEIDQLLLRTAGYVIATGVALTAYIAAVVGLGASLGGSRSWQVAAATLLALAVFGPVRRAAQGWIDRRFDREHEVRARLDAFLDRLRAGTDRPDRLEQVLREVSGTPDLELLLHLPAAGVFADVHGRPRTPDPGRALAELRTAGHLEAIAESDGPHGPVRSARTERLLQHARLAVQVARLGVELNQQLDEVDASRRRISIAADAERRRIQRDLHDGAQQRLVTVGLALRGLESRLRRRGEPEDADTVDALVADLQATIAGLRALVSDLPLPQLDGGIEPAFRELADRAPIAVHVVVDAPRLAPEVEATAYFLGCEGLTNVLKHARASTATLLAQRTKGHLLVSISDDGVGGASPGRGSGLVSLADRVAAMGGTLRIESADKGTLVEVVLPCG